MRVYIRETGRTRALAVNPAEVYKNPQLICLDLISQDVLLSFMNLHGQRLPPC